MWNCLSSQINGDSDISLSAGNTGVLLVISRMILKMMDKVNKPSTSRFMAKSKRNECCFRSRRKNRVQRENSRNLQN